MIERLLRASFSHSALTLILVLAASAMGAIWMQDLKRDVFPDLSAPVFNVIVQNPAMGAEELETGVAIPIEVALAGLPDVRRVRSSSQLGVSQITVEFESDADYYRSRQFVAERITQVGSQLPPGTDPPLISSLTGRLNEIFEFTLEAESGTADLMQLRDLGEFEIRNRLLALPGVAAVEVLGGYLRQFQVQIDPDRMSARGVSLDDVMHAVDGANVNAAGGFIVQGSTEWTIRAIGRVENLGDLRNTVVAVRGGTTVLLNDVADIVEAPAVRRGIAHRLKGEVVSCRVTKQFGSDTVAVSKGLREAIISLRENLPKGVQLRVVYDQAELVSSALGGVSRAILIGAFLVILVLLVLLGDWRAALVVTLTLPLSILLSGLLLKPAGIGINTMTLGGLAIAVGLLVDAAIIMTENIAHRITVRRNEGTQLQLALSAAIEVGRPIAFATLIVIAVFLPLFTMSGIEGRMYRPLAAAVIAAIGAALVLALTVVPIGSALFLRPKPVGEDEDVWLIQRLKQWYAPVLDKAMAHRRITILFSFVITIPVLVLGTYVGSDFMPKLDEGALMITTSLPPEASLAEVDRVNHHVEDILRTFPEVEDVVRRTGRGERTEDPMLHTFSDVLVVLKKDRKRSPEELEAAMREKLEVVAGVTIAYTTPLLMRIDEGLAGTPADISVRIFGPDLDQLAKLAEEAREKISKVRGIEDLRVEKLTGLPQLRVNINRNAVARAGLSPGDVVRAIRVGMAGEDVSQVWVGQRRYDLTVRLSDHHRDDTTAIKNLLIDTHQGTRIPLQQVAGVDETFGPSAIKREASSRRIAVEAAVAGRDLGSTAAEVRQVLAKELKLPPGYFLDIAGRVESQARATRALWLAIATALGMVFLLLYVALDSFADALVILATLPIAFVGSILALILAGETWNVSSLVGLIGLFGIAVQNGLVLVTQTRALVGQGLSFGDAIREASIGRVRPKIMTAACAILGLLPILIFRLHGTEIERPLAIVMIGGLVTSTIFTLLALPTFYLLVHKLKERK